MIVKLLKFLVVLALAVAVFGGGAYWAWLTWFAPRQVGIEEEAPAVLAPYVPPDPAAPLLERARQARTDGRGADVVAALQELIRDYPQSAKATEARQWLGEMQVQAFLRSEGVEYVVGRGDTLAGIAGKHRTNPELIFRANNLENTMLQIGQRLRVPKPEFSIGIVQATGAVRLYRGDAFFREYTAADHKVPSPGTAPGQVTERISWRAAQRVAFGSKEFADATRWIVISQPPMTLYTDWQAAGVTDRNDTRRPTAGVGLLPEAIDELFVLVARGTPVRIE
jgi:LysM repeat protein